MKTVASLVAIAGLAAGASADILANWTFEVSVPTTAGPHVAEGGVFAGTSEATGFHILPGVVYSNPVGNGSVESFSSNFWSAGDYYQFTTSTLLYNNITVSWEQTRSSTGPATFDLEYSLNGTDFFTVVNDYNVDQVTWSSLAFTPGSSFGPFALPAAADNQALVYIRMTSQVTVATGGTNRIDDVTVQGTLIPTPGALALMGLGALVTGRRRR